MLIVYFDEQCPNLVRIKSSVIHIFIDLTQTVIEDFPV